MKTSSSLLLEESPLVFQPSLAVAIGLNAAIVLQQFHYWIRHNRQGERNYRGGRYWTYQTLQDLYRQFPFWSERTLQRTLKSLVEQGILLSAPLRAAAGDRTLWYAIDYDALQRIEEENIPFRQYDEMGKQVGQNDEMVASKWRNGYRQNDEMDIVKMANSLKGTETPTETNQETPPKTLVSATSADDSEFGESDADLLDYLYALLKQPTPDSDSAPSTATPIEPQAKSQPAPPPTQKSHPRRPGETPEFEAFYAAYPNKKGRPVALKAWQRLEMTPALFAEIMAGLVRAINSYEWRKNESRFIPHPSTWLNREGWNDEYADPAPAAPLRKRPAQQTFAESQAEILASIKARRAQQQATATMGRVV